MSGGQQDGPVCTKVRLSLKIRAGEGDVSRYPHCSSASRGRVFNGNVWDANRERLPKGSWDAYITAASARPRP